MGADTVETRFTVSNEHDLAKLSSIFSDVSSDYFSNCEVVSLSDDKTLLKFESGSKLQTENLMPLYFFIAAHCNIAPTLRCWSSATGGMTFISSQAGKPDWSASDRPLEGQVIATTGGRLFDHGHLESLGAICREKFDNDVNLIGFGENGNEEWLARAQSSSVRVVSESELTEMEDGWYLFPPSTISWGTVEPECGHLRKIDSANGLVEWLGAYNAQSALSVELPQPGQSGQALNAFFGTAVLLLFLVGVGAYYIVKLIIAN